MKICPSCGKKVDANAKFCTYCGHSFELKDNNQTTVANNQQNDYKSDKAHQEWVERKQKAKNFSSNYFAWLVSTIRNPRMFKHSEKHFGLTSFIISLVLLGIIVFEAIQNAINKGIDYGGSIFSSIMASNAAQSAKTFVYFNLFILILLLLITVIGIPYLSRKITYIDNKESFKDYLNGLASYSNLVLLLEVITVIAMLFNVSSIAIVLVYFIPFIYSFAMCVSILDGGKDLHDRFYCLLISFITNGIVVAIIFALVFKSLLGMLSTIGSN